MTEILRPLWPAIITLVSSLILHLVAALADSPAVRTLVSHGPGRMWRRRFRSAPDQALQYLQPAALAVFLLLTLGAAFGLTGAAGESAAVNSQLLSWRPLQWITLVLASVLLVSQIGSARAIRAAECADAAWILSITAGLLTLSVSDSLLLILGGQALLSCSVIGLLRQQREQAGPAGSIRGDVGSAAHRPTESLRIALFRIALANAVAAYGLALLYVGSGQVQLSEMHEQVTQHVLAGHRMPLLDLGSVLLVSGLALQAGLPPFHFGRDESLSGLSWWVAGSVALGTGLASLLILVRVSAFALLGQPVLQIALITLSITALTAGNLRMLRTARLERLLSSLMMISVGSALAPLALANWSLQPDALAVTFGLSHPTSNPVAVVWLTTQLLSFAGLIAVLTSLESPAVGVRFEDDLRGLIVQRPVAGICAAVCLVSLAGLPPSVGFWSRWLLILSVESVQFEEPFVLAFAIILGLNLVVTAVACLRLVSILMGTRPLRHARPLQRPLALLGGMSVAGTLLVWGWSPGLLLRAICSAF